ncbi:hypothetical protein HMPREF1062_03098 [Bacteroides cellulosilyticus CL02T12C19]|jgi:hypothetical protein|uniref:Uncharacterized protein n=1 Tax=Bacteroides cellulosilyticus CL02T12C19 TaxID=997874 RepID=I9QJD7_9BACE|nr:hypothetical protein HMPREF1062_03098 [Bacteroides cellulosilyticus CL02T12C19]
MSCKLVIALICGMLCFKSQPFLILEPNGCDLAVNGCDFNNLSHL